MGSRSRLTLRFPEASGAGCLLVRHLDFRSFAISRANRKAEITGSWQSDWCIRLESLGSNFQRHSMNPAAFFAGASPLQLSPGEPNGEKGSTWSAGVPFPDFRTAGGCLQISSRSASLGPGFWSFCWALSWRGRSGSRASWTRKPCFPYRIFSRSLSAASLVGCIWR